MAKRQHAMATIEEQGLTQVTKSKPKQTAIISDIQPSIELRGKQLAEAVIQECRNQAGVWQNYLATLITLAKEGRKAFRETLAAMTARPKDENGKFVDYDEVAVKARNSARTRLSELTTISKALDAGLVVASDWAFHMTVGHARTFLKSQAMGSARGRKAKSAEDKMKDYLLKHAKEVGGLDALESLVHELVTEQHNQEEAPV